MAPTFATYPTALPRGRRACPGVLATAGFVLATPRRPARCASLVGPARVGTSASTHLRRPLAR